jgi:NAD(P)-dependent dehydrogenase (short-subunit alcohol dehydrogenase family)
MENKKSYLEKMFSLDGKVALITGAGGHLCSSFAAALANAGSKIALIDIRKEKAEEVAAKIRTEGIKDVEAFHCDTSNLDQVKALASEVDKTFGEVDILINGSGTNSSTPFFDLTEEDWDNVYSSQVKSTLFMSQIFGKHMVDRQRGCIINVSSASASPPLSRAFCYSTSKASILNLTQNLAREFASSNVRVNAIRPGFFPTEWNIKNFIDDERKTKILDHTPMKRFGEPNELSTAILYLASDYSTFVTGSEVSVDGGFSCMTI